MEQSQNYRKLKLLRLLELLRQETDEQHPMTTNQICIRLANMGIPVDRRVLSQDIALLNQAGYEVMSSWLKHEKAYYVEDRDFSISELRILIDAVQAASFITQKKTEELVNKIAALAGEHQAGGLTRNMVRFNAHKHHNENIYYNVDCLEKAITEQKKILFRYFDIGANGEKHYRRDGHRYVVEPISLVFNEDNYYILCYSSRHGKTSIYRIDRMEAVTILEELCSEQALAFRNNVEQYTEQTFKMFGGRLETVTLTFGKEVIGPVFDKFGEDIEIKKIDNIHCAATVDVQISPVFWGWLFQFAGDMKILQPESMVEEYRKRAEMITQQNETI